MCRSLVLLFALIAISFAQPLAVLNITSSDPYTIGHQIGQTFSAQMKRALDNDPQFESLYFWATGAGSGIFEAIVYKQSELYPQYIQELQGMSDGAHINLTSLLVENLAADIINLVPELAVKRIDHCSDVLLINKDLSEWVHGHNEDDDQFWQGLTFLLATPNWSAYTYAAQLAGNAFAWTTSGLSITMNSMFPNQSHPNGAGQYFIMRDVLEAKNLGDAIRRATQNPVMSGFSANIGSRMDRAMVNIETAPDGGVSIARYEYPDNPGKMPHFNQYLYLAVPQFPDASSVHRLDRYKTFKPMKTNVEVQNFMGDTQDSQYPVYRSGQTDGVYTLATMIADLRMVNNTGISIYTTNPSNGSQPTYNFQWAPTPSQ